LSQNQIDLFWIKSISYAIDLHLQAGIRAHKINPGIPSYGKIWKGVKFAERN